MSIKTRLTKLEQQLRARDEGKEPIIIEDYANTDPTAFFILALITGRHVHAGPLRQNSCRLKFLKKIKFELRDENVYKVF